MVVFPNCKINLGLRVLEKRTDGYHNLDTVFYPLPLRDASEIIESPRLPRDQDLEFHVTGKLDDCPPDQNLCYKAWKIIAEDFQGLPPLKMYLHKVIPAGAGLGGGSSNAAFTLKLLNDLLGLKIPEDKLAAYALQLGSDCPFFLVNKPCHATGRGELLREVPLNLGEYQFVLVHPGFHVNTRQAFTGLAQSKPAKPSGDLPTTFDIVQKPVTTWKDELVNDFEGPVFMQHPELSELKEQLYSAGAIYASLTGTGSCIYGIFRKTDQPDLNDINASFSVYKLNSDL